MATSPADQRASRISRASSLRISTPARLSCTADNIIRWERIRQKGGEGVLSTPHPAILWKNDPQSQRRAANREFKGQNPQGGTAISVWAKSDVGAGKLEFLQTTPQGATNVVSTMDVDIKAGMNRFQWGMRGPAPPGAGRGGQGGQAATPTPGPAGTSPAPPPEAAPGGAQGGGTQGGGVQPGGGQGGGRGGRGGASTGVPFVAGG